MSRAEAELRQSKACPEKKEEPVVRKQSLLRTGQHVGHVAPHILFMRQSWSFFIFSSLKTFFN